MNRKPSRRQSATYCMSETVAVRAGDIWNRYEKVEEHD